VVETFELRSETGAFSLKLIEHSR
jgi:hypothetical protein